MAITIRKLNCVDADVENSNASYTDTVPSGGTLVLPDITVTDSDGSTFTQPSVENVVCTLSPDTDLEVNGTPEGTFAAGSTIDVRLNNTTPTIVTPSVTVLGNLVELEIPDSDVNVNGNLEGTVASAEPIDIDVTDGVNPVTPTAINITGNTVTIEVPSGGGGAPVGATLMRTGQTTVYRTGDDVDTSAEGRATDFFTLASNNPFGNTDRFTDELGGQTYTDNIVIDWSTYDGATVLGYYRLRGTYLDVTWNNAIDNSLLFSIGLFTSGWRLPNINELLNLKNSNAIRPLDYAPFNFSAATIFWTSTTNPATTANALTFENTNNQMVRDRIKTNTLSSYRAIPVRTFTVTGTTLT